MNESNYAESPYFTTMPDEHDSYEVFHSFDAVLENPDYHSHDYYEIYLHIQGGEQFELDSRRFELGPGELVVIPPFCMHGIVKPTVLRDYERAFVNVSPDILRALGCGAIDLDRFFRSYTARGHYSFLMSPEETRDCLGFIDRLIEAGQRPGETGRYYRSVQLANFLCQVCRIMEKSLTADGPAPSAHVLQQVLTYINSHYTQAIRLEEIARQFGLSVSSLSHSFARYANRSIYDYVLYRRVMLARKLMLTDQSLSSIAYQCGFNDYSNFLRMFTKFVGVSPSRYRREHLVNGQLQQDAQRRQEEQAQE